jgi:hypothetical protein
MLIELDRGILCGGDHRTDSSGVTRAFACTLNMICGKSKQVGVVLMQIMDDSNATCAALAHVPHMGFHSLKISDSGCPLKETKWPAAPPESDSQVRLHLVDTVYWED